MADRLIAAIVDGPDSTTEVFLGAGDHDLMRFPLARADPKLPVRFAVGRPGRRSSMWRLWANSAKDDVYLATRQSAGIFKVSLHASGDWRLQWVSADRGDVRWTAFGPDEPDGRVLHRWQRPPPGRSGWTDAMSVWVPEPDVVEIPGDAEPSHDVQWLDPPAPGDAVELRLVLAQPARVAVELTGALHPGRAFALVNGFRLASGETAVLFAATRPLEDQTRRRLAQTRRAQRAAVHDGFDLDPASGPRAAAITVDDDGYLNPWDLNLAGT